MGHECFQLVDVSKINLEIETESTIVVAGTGRQENEEWEEYRVYVLQEEENRNIVPQ